MKRKSLFLTILTLVMLTCFSVAFAVTATAGAETVVSEFKMHGASVRLTEGTTGLRFECLVDSNTYNAVTAENSGKTFGAFIVPKDILDDMEITGFTSENTHVEQFSEKKVRYKSIEGIGGEQVSEDDDNYPDHILYFSFVTIQYGNYTRDFYCLFYIKTGTGESATYEYADIDNGNNVRNVGDVAAQYVNAGELNDTAIDFAVKAQYIKNNGFDPENSNETAAQVSANTVTAARLQTVVEGIGNLPTVARVSIADYTTVNATKTECDALSDEGKTLFIPSASQTAINEVYNELSDKYTMLFDLSDSSLFSANAVSFNDMQSGWVRLHGSYTMTSDVTSSVVGKDAYYGNYVEINATIGGGRHLILSYKKDDLSDLIEDGNNIYMYVYNGDTSSRSFYTDFGGTAANYKSLPASSWTLIEVSKSDFISGTFFGITCWGGTHNLKFGSIFTCSEEYAAKLNDLKTIDTYLIDAIDGLGVAPAYNTVDKDTSVPAALTEVIASYETISSICQPLVTNRENIDRWKVVNVIKAIDGIEAYSENISVAHNQSKFSAAQTVYEALNETLQSEVVNSAKLTAWTEKAEKVKLLYATRDEFRSNITNKADNPVVQNAEQVETTPPQGFGDLHALRGVGSDNYYIVLNTIPDLTGYDVVRFPIWLNIASDTAYYNLVYKFNGGSLAAGYARLYKGLNIVTVPVSFLFEGFCIGVNSAPAGQYVYYAIPYAEKLSTGDTILADYDLECNKVFASTTTYGSYLATVTGSSGVDVTYGTVAKFAAVKNESSGVGSNYAVYFNKISQLKNIVASIGATSVKFKVYKNGAGGSLSMYLCSDNSPVQFKTLTTVQDTWTEIELTAEEVASWNGYIRKDWGTSVDMWFTDFTIVK